MISHGGVIMTTFTQAGKTAFGKSDAKNVSPRDGASAHEFAMQPGSIRFRNHETLTARGWLAHRPSWPKDQDAKYGVAITYGENRILVAVAPARNRPRSRKNIS
jgi:hypothetical protein